MLIRLQPAIPLPTVLFAVNFPNLPDNLPTCPAWAAQLSLLSNDDLEIPEAFHALDSAVKIPSILEEVSFDIPSLTVSCRFVDGMIEEWPLMGSGFVRALESVLDDVNESSLETEREKKREKEKQRLLALPPAPAPVAAPPQTTKVKRHRKQRSMILSFMANLVAPNSSSSQVSVAPLVPAPVPVVEAPSVSLPPPPSLSPRALRRRARSTLVDTFRKYIQGELNQRLPSGGYYTWIASSMLRRANEHMAQIVEQAGESAPGLLVHQRKPLNDDSAYFSMNTPAPASSSFHSSDDGEFEEQELEDTTDADTDTDGSSLHTPCSSMFTPSPRTTYYQDDDSVSDVKSSQATGLSAESCIAYTAYSSMAQRLRQLLVLANARATHFDNEVKARDSILEIRSRRRAWLNKTLAGSGLKDFGLATPFKPSLLGSYYWCADNVVDHVYHEEEAEQTEQAHEWGTESDMLFPISEPEDDDDDEDEDYHDIDLDGLSGTSWHRENVSASSSGTQRPSVRRNPVSYYSSPRHSSDTSALLCKPLAKLSVASDKPPMYSELDPEEFTLSMDVPFNARGPSSRQHAKKRTMHPLQTVSDESWFSQVEFGPISGL